MRASALCALALGAAIVPGSPNPAVAAAAEVLGKPWIIDGATVEVAGRRFCLAGIRVPALDQNCRRAGQEYPCGKVARAVLWGLVGGREVSCAPVAGAGGTDAGALAATCRAGEIDLNQGMVAAGWALAAPTGAEPYGALEQAARTEHRGLWSGEFELPRAANTE